MDDVTACIMAGPAGQRESGEERGRWAAAGSWAVGGLVAAFSFFLTKPFFLFLFSGFKTDFITSQICSELFIKKLFREHNQSRIIWH